MLASLRLRLSEQRYSLERSVRCCRRGCRDKQEESEKGEARAGLVTVDDSRVPKLLGGVAPFRSTCLPDVDPLQTRHRSPPSRACPIQLYSVLSLSDEVVKAVPDDLGDRLGRLGRHAWRAQARHRLDHRTAQGAAMPLSQGSLTEDRADRSAPSPRSQVKFEPITGIPYDSQRLDLLRSDEGELVRSLEGDDARTLRSFGVVGQSRPLPSLL